MDVPYLPSPGAGPLPCSQPVTGGDAGGPHRIEIGPEVRERLAALPVEHSTKAEEDASLPAESGPRLPKPFGRRSEDGLYELRPMLGGVPTRITFSSGPERRTALLPVSRTTRMHET